MASQDWTARERVLWLALLLGGLGLTWWVLQYYIGNGWLMADAHAYWTTGQEGYDPYSVDVGGLDAYLYSPAFAQVISVITWLPWPVFAGLWAGLEVLAFVWLLRPLGWAWAGVLLLWCSPELALGNIFGFIAVATVLALTGTPQAWALPVLTKPSLTVGMLWHITRREWRKLAVAALTIGVVVLASVAIDPQMWQAWLQFLAAPSAGRDVVLGLRILMSVGVVVFAARTSQPWLVPFALVLATPHIGSVSVLTTLAAVPRLTIVEPDGRTAASPPGG